jgi:hypothetical protein
MLAQLCECVVGSLQDWPSACYHPNGHLISFVLRKVTLIICLSSFCDKHVEIYPAFEYNPIDDFDLWIRVLKRLPVCSVLHDRSELSPSPSSGEFKDGATPLMLPPSAAATATISSNSSSLLSISTMSSPPATPTPTPPMWPTTGPPQIPQMPPPPVPGTPSMTSSLQIEPVDSPNHTNTATSVAF